MAKIRKTNRSKKKCSPTSIIVTIIILYKICYFWSDISKTKPDTIQLPQTQTQIVSRDSSNPITKSPAQCSYDDLLKIRHQLPPEMCIADYEGNTLYLQRCSLTLATKCPKATWLEEYYQELQQQQHSQFVGISIGCNKGFDAIHTLRMGTSNHLINKKDWKQAMEEKGGTLHESVCGQDTEDSSNTFSIRNTTIHGEMHCVEPMPNTFDSLQYSSKHLHYDEYGFHVTNAAIAKESGTMYFPSNPIPVRVLKIKDWQRVKIT